jgi:hypothetical protein
VIAPVLALLQEEPAGSGMAPLVGGLIVGVGVIDLALAFYFGFVHRMPRASEQARKILPLALAAGGLLMCGFGAAVLAGAIPI